MSYKHPGITKPTFKSCALGNQVALGFKKPVKKRKAETKPRKAYDREEDRVRPLLAKLLEKHGWILRRVEPYCNYGDKGFNLGDWWGHNPGLKIMAWIECKSMDGDLTEGQKKFRKDCKECSQPYYVVRPMDYEVTRYKFEVL